MSLYQLKLKSTSNTTAMSTLLFAADSIQDVSNNIDYIKKYGAWFYHFPGVYWNDSDAAQMCGLNYNNRLSTNLRDIYVEGNGETLVNIANGGPEYHISGGYVISTGGTGFNMSVSRNNSTPYSSVDYYTNYTMGDSILATGGAVPSQGQDPDSYPYRHFALIPVFKHTVDSTYGFDCVNPDESYFILCYCSYDGTNNILKRALTVITSNARRTDVIPFYDNSHTPMGAGRYVSGRYQFFMSLLESYTKIRDGSETSGNEVYNDPNNPNASAYPAQGYRQDGTPIDLFSPGANVGIGGNGNHTAWTDIIESAGPSYLGGDDTTPDISTSGLLTIYEIDSTQLTTLASELWSTPFLQSLGNSNLNPLECVISLYACKVPVLSRGTGPVVIGRYDSSISSATLAYQYNKITLPNFFIERYWDTWLDQNPHTKLCLYLPYIGIVEINPDYYMGKNLKIEYNFDFLSALCVVHLYANNILVETKQGNFGAQLPLTSSRHQNILGNIMQLVAGVGITAAGVALTATGIGAAAGAATMAAGASGVMAAAGGVASAVGGINQAANAVNQMQKYNYSIASQIQSQAAFMSPNSVYLFRVLDGAQLPANYTDLTGIPVFTSTIVENLKGFSSIKNIQLDNVTATESEKEELIRILQAGAIYP